MRNKAMTFAVSVLAVAAIACGSAGEVSPGGGKPEAVKDAKAAAPLAVKVGQQLKVNTSGLGATYTLSKMEQKTTDEWDMKPDEGVYLIGFLRVDVSKGETFACACELSLVQKDGKVREQGYASFKGKPAFESAELKAGQHADGWVVFELPKKAIKGSKIQLKISALFADSEYGYWTVA